jgi:hypothetical protein
VLSCNARRDADIGGGEACSLASGGPTSDGIGRSTHSRSSGTIGRPATARAIRSAVVTLTGRAGRGGGGSGHRHPGMARYVGQGQAANLHRVAQLGTEGDATVHALHNLQWPTPSDTSQRAATRGQGEAGDKSSFANGVPRDVRQMAGGSLKNGIHDR